MLIYLEILEEYREYIKKVLLKLRDANLAVKLEKYEFNSQQVQFLGYIISLGQIKIDKDKVKATLE